MEHSKCAFKSYFILFLLVISVDSAFSQQKLGSAESKEPKLITTGLHNEKLIKNIFLGKFLEIPFDRDNINFSVLFDVYVTAYARYCGANLPADKIELTRQECDEWLVTKNGYGLEIRRQCTRWKTVGTGLYASPEMFYAKEVIDNLQTGDAFRTLLKMLSQENPVGAASNLVQDGLVMKQDIADLFTMNGCSSQGLKRFEENLRLFALNKQPVVLGDDSTQKSNPNFLSRNQNFQKLIDDLIYEQSMSWAMNKYQRQSVTNVNITSRDNNGRPSTITANYQYQGWSNKSTGSVTITFVDGLPNCLYFFDFPTTCRTASRKIVANYLNGAYVNQ